MADSVLYLVHGVAGRDDRWRESVEMALTGAAFALPTRIWLGEEVVAALSGRSDGAESIAELAGFGIVCVADRRHQQRHAPAAIEWLSASELTTLRDEAAQLIVL